MNHSSSQFAYDTHQLMDVKSVRLSFSGEFSPDLISVLLLMAKNTIGGRPVMKKIYNIMIECLENITKHAFICESDTFPAIFVLGKDNDFYYLATGNKIIQDKLGSSNLMTKIIAWLTGTLIGPVISFFKKNGFNIAIAILGFVFLFKIGEAFLGRMSVIFYKEIGFTKTDIALYSKGLGWITTVIFTLLGGLFAIRSGVIKAMFVSGILMASTNLLFSLLAWSGKSELLFAIAVIFDDMAAAFATVAFVAFISMLVDRTYTATQYALLASIGTAGRTTLAASSGALVDWLNGDWGIFFIITAVMVVPSLIFLYLIKDKLKLND